MLDTLSKDSPTTDRFVASVAVIPPIAGHEVLSYAVPAELRGSLRAGQRVLVPLAKRQVTGIVLAVGDVDEPRGVRLRDVLDVLDDQPLLSEELLALCRFAARYYVAPLGEVLATAVLAGLRAETRRTVRRVAAPASAPSPSLGRTEQAILARLARLPLDRAVRTSTLSRDVRSSSFYAALRSLAARGLVVIEERAARATASVRFERVCKVARQPSEAEGLDLERRARHSTVSPLHRGTASRHPPAELERRTPATLAALVRAGIARLEAREVYRETVARRDPLDGAATPTAQQRAIDAIGTRPSAGALRAVPAPRRHRQRQDRGLPAGRRARALERGAACWCWFRRSRSRRSSSSAFRARFGDAVAVLHSGLSDGERFDEWRRLARRRGARRGRRALGACSRRSPALGLVVVDEEHDGSYKQEEGVRYNARDLAIVRARDGALSVVLGSATPSMESRYNAELGRYSLPRAPRTRRTRAAAGGRG